jgi:phosphatidylglycerol:prolipoprotein diacylglycerol transferase
MLELMAAGTLTFPNIDPFALGPIEVFGRELGLRWYSLAYIVGLVFAWWYIRRLAAKPGAAMSPVHIDDFITWAVFGVILGGRLGYVLFYRPESYLADPMSILRLWDGGMSFHGGFLGVVLAVIFYCRKHKLDLMRVADVVAIVSPFGLLTGRLANFINGELWGRAAPEGAWYGMVFPADRLQIARHPSQLYEAALEGVLLFLILQFLYHKTRIAKEMPGAIAGFFMIGYGLARILVENVREPDVGVAFIFGLTRGQLLSTLMFLLAAWLVSKGLRYRADLKAKGKL